MYMNQGIGQFESEARRLAGLGRNGDVYIAHLAEGETVVPMEIFDANPEMRNMLFSQMKSMGIEPERYIVGNELNSINPVTGQPEFFLKRVFNGVKDVLKEAAPIIIPIAINAALGPAGSVGSQFLRSAAVSGITSLLQGAETEDALKNALIAGGIGAAQRSFAPEFLGGPREGGQAGVQQQNISPQDINFARAQDAITDSSFTTRMGGKTPLEFYDANPGQFEMDVKDFNLAEYAYTPSPEEPSFFKSVFNQGAPEKLDLTGTREFAEAKQRYLDAGLDYSPKEAAEAALSDLTSKYTPTFFDKYGLPMLGVGALAFLPEEEIEEEEQMSIQDFIDANYPPDYFDMDITQRQAQGPFEVPPPGVGFGAEGGNPAFFPRRTGAIGPGIGSGTEDDVPAMLMDGEFVFTKKAVNGLGGGDEVKGMQRMYDLMRNFEAMA